MGFDDLDAPFGVPVDVADALDGGGGEVVPDNGGDAVDFAAEAGGIVGVGGKVEMCGVSWLVTRISGFGASGVDGCL